MDPVVTQLRDIFPTADDSGLELLARACDNDLAQAAHLGLCIERFLVDRDAEDDLVGEEDSDRGSGAGSASTAGGAAASSQPTVSTSRQSSFPSLSAGMLIP